MVPLPCRNRPQRQRPPADQWQRLARDFKRGRRRLRITREGKVFILLVCGIGIGAINTGNNLLYLLLGSMLAIIVMSGVLAEVALSYVDVRALQAMLLLHIAPAGAGYHQVRLNPRRAAQHLQQAQALSRGGARNA